MPAPICWLSLALLAWVGCTSDLGTATARVEAVEVRAAFGGPVTSAAYAFEWDRQRYLNAADVPRGMRRPRVGDTVTVRVMSAAPVRTEIVAVAPSEARSLPSVSAVIQGDSAVVTTPDTTYSLPRDSTRRVP